MDRGWLQPWLGTPAAEERRPRTHLYVPWAQRREVRQGPWEEARIPTRQKRGSGMEPGPSRAGRSGSPRRAPGCSPMGGQEVGATPGVSSDEGAVDETWCGRCNWVLVPEEAWGRFGEWRHSESMRGRWPPRPASLEAGPEEARREGSRTGQSREDRTAGRTGQSWEDGAEPGGQGRAGGGGGEGGGSEGTEEGRPGSIEGPSGQQRGQL